MKRYLSIIGILLFLVSSLITLDLFYRQRLQMDMAEQFSKRQLLIARSAASDMEKCLKKVSEEAAAFSLTMSDKGEKMYSLLNDVPLVSGWEYAKRAVGLSPGQSIIHQDGIITPIYRNGSMAGAVFFENPIFIIAKRFLSHIASGARGYAWMMDDRNLPYHPTQPDMIGKNLYMTDTSCSTCHVFFNLEKKIIEGKDLDYGGYPPTGDDKILSFSKAEVGDSSWIIAVSAPYSKVITALKKSLELYSVLIIAIFLTACFTATLLITYHRKKIKAEELARHEKELEKYAHELEQKVHERTRELADEKEKLDTVVSAMGGGLLLIDKEGRIRWANKMMEEMASADIIGRTCEEICYECDISGSYSQDNIETTMLSNLFGRKGKYFQITTAPVKGDDSEIHGYIRLVQDVTEMKRMEDRIAHSEKLAAIGRLAAGIAHEIGNPMTSIFSFVQILRDMEDDAFKKESLDTIYFHINRISEILKQLSGFAKTPGEGESLSRVHVNEIIEESINLIQYDKKAGNISIKKELSPSLPDIRVDANRLAQVFVNLTLNAMDAMSDGGTFTVRSMTADGDLIIQFEDTGTGISPDDIHKIFDPFHTTKERGTGLGLAISFNIIKKMGGELSVESEVGKGSLFTVRIPASS